MSTDKDPGQTGHLEAGTGTPDAHPSGAQQEFSEPSKPRRLLPVVRDTGTDHAAQRISMAAIEPDPDGCPQCDDFADWPAHHCGRPACRDAQAIAWAQQTGRDPAAVLASLDAPQQSAGGLCGACKRADGCTVGQAVLAAVDAVGAAVGTCPGHVPQA